MWLTDIGFVERSGPTKIYNLRECVFNGRLVSMVVDPHGPASRCEGQADGATNPSGCTGHKHGVLGFNEGSRHVSRLSRRRQWEAPIDTSGYRLTTPPGPQQTAPRVPD